MNDQEMNEVAVGQNLSGRNLFSWAVGMVTGPRRFFAALAKRGGFKTPVGYALCWLFLSTVMELLVGRLRPQPIRVGWVIEVGSLAAVPLVMIGIGFIVAAVLFVIWHLMGSPENYETAFRCWAFITPISVLSALLSVVPFLNVLALLYGLFLLVIASIETHRISSARSWTVWGALCAVFLALIGVAVGSRSALSKRGFGVPPEAGMLEIPGLDANGPNAQQLQELQKQLQRMKKDEAGPAE